MKLLTKEPLNIWSKSFWKSKHGVVQMKVAVWLRQRMMTCSHTEGIKALGTWLVLFSHWFTPFHVCLCGVFSCAFRLMSEDGLPSLFDHLRAPPVSGLHPYLSRWKHSPYISHFNAYAQYHEFMHLQCWCHPVMNSLLLQCYCHAACVQDPKYVWARYVVCVFTCSELRMPSSILGLFVFCEQPKTQIHNLYDDINDLNN